MSYNLQMRPKTRGREGLTQFVDDRRFVPVASVDVLSEAHMREFNEFGFTIVKGVIPPDRVRTLVDAAARLFEPFPQQDYIWISAPETLAPAIDRYFWSREMQSIITDMNGPSDILLGFILRKTAKVDTCNTKPWHQDGLYWGGPDQNVCATFTPLTPFREDNSELLVIPGSHKLGRLHHWAGPSYALVCDVSSLREPRAITAEPGDVIVLHSLTVHASNPCRSSESRINLGCHWYKKGSHVLLDKNTARTYGRTSTREPPRVPRTEDNVVATPRAGGRTKRFASVNAVERRRPTTTSALSTRRSEARSPRSK